MFIRRALAVVLAILWMWPAGVYAQSEALMEANRRGYAFYESGQHEQATPFWRKALEFVWRKALEFGEEEFGSDHPTTGNLLNNLAILYLHQGRYAEAEPLYKRALAIREKALGPEHPDVATSLNELAALYHAQGRYADAEPLSKRALAIQEWALGPDHPDVATSLGNLASMYLGQGRHTDAEPLYKRSLAIQEGVGLVWKIEVIDLVRFWCRDGRPKTAIRDNGALQGRILSRRQGRAGEGGNAPHRQKRYDAVS